MSKSSVLILGGTGNLGQSIRRISPSDSDHIFHFPTRNELPLHEEMAVVDYLVSLKPKAIINGAAWTNVEAAETHQAEARYMNASLPKLLAAWCLDNDTKFIHFSTDYVFDGLSPLPYLESDEKNPISFYGESKSAGEQAILSLDGLRGTIIRTSGLYGFTSNNFVMKVLKRAMVGEELSVVKDQQMTPTNADDLAAFVLSLLHVSNLPKLIHFSNTGSTNWNEVAREIYRFVGEDPIKVKEIVSSEYPSVAKRPQQSRLETLYADLSRHNNFGWKDSLQRFLKEVVHG